RFTMLWFAGSVGAFALGLQWGTIGVAACYAVATALIEPVRTYVTTRALRISVWKFVGAFSGVVQATALMAAVVLAARSALVAAGLPPAARLVLLVALGACVYVAGCLWRAPEITREIKGAIGGRSAPTPRIEAAE